MIRRVNITIRQGESWRPDQPFQVRDPITGDPVDITGWTGTMTLWDDAGTVLTTVAMSIVYALYGQATYNMTAVQSAALPVFPTFVRYDMKFVRADATVGYFQEGIVYVEKPTA